MAMTIEALLEENVGKVQQLLATGEAAHRDVTAVDELAQRIESQFHTSTGSALAGLRALQGVVADLESAFEEADALATQGWETLGGQLLEAENQAQASLAEFTQTLNNTQVRLDEADAGLQAGWQSADAGIEQLLGNATDYKSSLEAAVEKSKGVSAELAQQVETAIEDLSKKNSAVISAFDSASRQADEDLETLKQSLQEGVQLTGDKLAKVLEDASSTSQKSAANVREKISDNGLKSLDTGLRETSQSIETVKHVTEKLGLDLGDSLGGVMDQMKEIVALVQRIKPALDLIDELL